MEVCKKSFLFNWVIFRVPAANFQGFYVLLQPQEETHHFSMEIYVAHPQNKIPSLFLGGWRWGVDRLDFHESLNLESTTWVNQHDVSAPEPWPQDLVMGIGGRWRRS